MRNLIRSDNVDPEQISGQPIQSSSHLPNTRVELSNTSSTQKADSIVKTSPPLKNVFSRLELIQRCRELRKYGKEEPDFEKLVLELPDVTAEEARSIWRKYPNLDDFDNEIASLESKISSLVYSNTTGGETNEHPVEPEKPSKTKRTRMKKCSKSEIEEMEFLLYDKEMAPEQIAEVWTKKRNKPITGNTVRNYIYGRYRHSDREDYVNEGLLRLRGLREALGFRIGDDFVFHGRMDRTPYNLSDGNLQELTFHCNHNIVLAYSESETLDQAPVDALIDIILIICRDLKIVFKTITTDKDRTFTEPVSRLTKLMGTIHLYDRVKFLGRAYEELEKPRCPNRHIRDLRHHYYSAMRSTLYSLNSKDFYLDVTRLEQERPIWSEDPITAKFVQELIKDQYHYGPGFDLNGAFVDIEGVEGKYGTIDKKRRKQDLSRTKKNWKTHFRRMLSRKNLEIMQNYVRNNELSKPFR